MVIFFQKNADIVEDDEANHASTVSLAATQTRVQDRDGGSMKPDNQY